jgi:FixJ family two-component response regulator
MIVHVTKALSAPGACGGRSLSEERLVSVIDDDASLLTAIVKLVRSLGYNASGHETAEAFLSSGESDTADCVITDIQMPGMSGIDLQHLLHERKIDVPVIMITARNEPALLERARASGAHCLLSKPFAPEEFIDCLEQALA